MSQVLIVDDERAIRDLITTGFRGDIRIIHQATDGEAALEMLRGSDYDCILLDLRIPGIIGMEVFEKIVSSSPSLADRIIFMTGDTASPESAAFLSDKSNRVISKPFQLADTRRSIGYVVSASCHP